MLGYNQILNLVSFSFGLLIKVKSSRKISFITSKSSLSLIGTSTISSSHCSSILIGFFFFLFFFALGRFVTVDLGKFEFKIPRDKPKNNALKHAMPAFIIFIIYNYSENSIFLIKLLLEFITNSLITLRHPFSQERI